MAETLWGSWIFERIRVKPFCLWRKTRSILAVRSGVLFFFIRLGIPLSIPCHWPRKMLKGILLTRDIKGNSVRGKPVYYLYHAQLGVNKRWLKIPYARFPFICHLQRCRLPILRIIMACHFNDSSFSERLALPANRISSSRPTNRIVPWSLPATWKIYTQNHKKPASLQTKQL